MDLDRTTHRAKAAERKLGMANEYAPAKAPGAIGAGSGVVAVVVAEEEEGTPDEPMREPAVEATDRTGRTSRLSSGDVRLLEATYVGGAGTQPSRAAGFVEMAARMGLRFACHCAGDGRTRPAMVTSGRLVVRDASSPGHARGCRFEHSADDRRVAREREATVTHNLTPVRSGIEPTHEDRATRTKTVRTRLGQALAHALRLAGIDHASSEPPATSWQARLLSALAEMPFAGGRQVGLPAAASIHDLARLRNAIMRDEARIADSLPHGLLATVVDGVEDGSLRIGRERLAMSGAIHLEGCGPQDGPFVAAVLFAAKGGDEPEPVEAYLIPCLDPASAFPLGDPSERRTVRIILDRMAREPGARWRLVSSLAPPCLPTERLTLRVERGDATRTLNVCVLSSDLAAAAEAIGGKRVEPANQDTHALCHATRPGADPRRADDAFRQAVDAALRPPAAEIAQANQAAPQDKATAEPPPAADEEPAGPRDATPAEYLALLRSIGMQVDNQAPHQVHASMAVAQVSPQLLRAVGARP